MEREIVVRGEGEVRALPDRAVVHVTDEPIEVNPEEITVRASVEVAFSIKNE